jgi:hypothetical protein
MGKRARGQGITGAVVKGRHAEAARIGQAVYRAARDLQDDGGSEPVPLTVMSALVYLGQLAGPSIAQRYGLLTGAAEADERMVDDIGAYLTSGYLSMIAEFRPEHFVQWRAEADELQAKAAKGAGGNLADAGTRETRGGGPDGDSHDGSAGVGGAGAQPEAAPRRAGEGEPNQDVASVSEAGLEAPAGGRAGDAARPARGDADDEGVRPADGGA